MNASKRFNLFCASKSTHKFDIYSDGEIRQKILYEYSLMTDRELYYNGAERVVVSQIHRSPGVIFSHEKGIFSTRIIPYRGSWLEFEVDQKKELIYAKIDRKKRILGTIFLRALGISSREEIIKAFYTTEKIAVVDDRDSKEALIGKGSCRCGFYQRCRR